jgi:hypothetical protein
MSNLLEILIPLVSVLIDHVSTFLSAHSMELAMGGSGVTLAFAVVASTSNTSNIAEGVLAAARRWHGTIDDQFSNINNFVTLVLSHQPAWVIPEELLLLLTANRDQLQELINKCRSTAGSTADRTLRNTLLKSTVGICLMQGKIWAYGEYAAGVLTADDVHLLGFLLPGENGGRHARTEATDVVAEVKANVINADFVRVVIDQSSGENAAQVSHGWPAGVRNALIVITAADGKTEVHRQITTRLHNDIRMPEGSHGKQFIIKAAFLRHVNDEPRFGNSPTFSMPLTTEDLAAALDRQHHETFEAQLQEVERARREIERLQAELAAKK